ncbi:MAG: CPBP family glutamic-type intramembrane protease [Pirellulales bacterium]
MNTDSRPVGSADDALSSRFWAGLPWAPFVIPFLVYGLIGSLEPSDPPEPNLLGFTVAYEHYPLIYTVKIAATIAALAIFWPAYTQSPSLLWGGARGGEIPNEGTDLASPPSVPGGGARRGGFLVRVSPLAIVVGVVGGLLWIALAHVPLEQLLAPFGIGDWFARSDRPAFNPFEQLKDNQAWAYGFLGIRFIGLVLVVAMMEELFLRGFLMRFVMHANWPQVPFGEVNGTAIAVGTIFPMLTHPPSELLAVAVWFSLVTWLMVRTKNFWDCVAAHAITNLMLGIYVVVFKQWWLW